MESFYLRYSPDGLQGGIQEAILEEIYPWQDSSSELLQRMTHRLQVEHQMSLQQAQKEARALVHWCGLEASEEEEPDPSLGLVYLYQKLESKIGRGGTVLQMFNPEHAKMVGDGFRICEAILSQRAGKKAVLILASIDSEEANPQLFQSGRFFRKSEWFK